MLYRNITVDIAEQCPFSGAEMRYACNSGAAGCISIILQVKRRKISVNSIWGKLQKGFQISHFHF